MRVVLIGAGNVATHLGVALQRCGNQILMLYSRGVASAEKLAEKLGVPYTTALSELPSHADIYISLLTDSALIENASAIVQLSSRRAESIFVHTAGTLPLSLWADAGAQHYGVFYPMQTFSRAKEVDWQSIPIFVEGESASTAELLHNIASSISDRCFYLSSLDRGKLHLSAVFACNFVNRMYAISESLLQGMDLPFSIMLPLIEESLGKVRELSPHMAQTGPASRNDRVIMERHLSLLEEYPEWQTIYRELSNDILKSLKYDKL